MNIIEARDLVKRYGRTNAVDHLSMRVAQGDIYGFVGKNGAGKSTTMKMVAGLVTPTAGELALFSGGPYHRAQRDASASAAARRAGSFSGAPSRIGALIEEPGVMPNFSATRARGRRIAQGQEILYGHEAALGACLRARGVSRPAFA